MSPEFNRSFWLMLAAGVALRCIAINQPLLDAHAMRQVQTAAATEDLIKHSGFHLNSESAWSGDLHERYILEPPLYNYLVVPVYRLIGQLDPSGKSVSVILWAASFFALQFIWRRFLHRHQTIWPNLL